MKARSADKIHHSTQSMVYTKDSTEEQLIEGCRRRDRSAQRYLYARLYGRMLVICLRYTADKAEAEDVLNRAFLKIFNKIDDYQPTGMFTGWTAKIVFRTALDYVRSKTVYRRVMDFSAEKEPLLQPAVVDHLVAEDLYRAVQQLPDEMRAVFSLYVLDGYKHREIAEILDININTSKWHLSRAKKQMRELLRGMEEYAGYFKENTKSV